MRKLREDVEIYKIIILSVEFCGCETLSLALRGKYTLQIFGNRVLRRIFATTWDEKNRRPEKLHIEKLHNFYSSPKILRMI
jgi:hypothetical protein